MSHHHASGGGGGGSGGGSGPPDFGEQVAKDELTAARWAWALITVPMSILSIVIFLIGQHHQQEAAAAQDRHYQQAEWQGYGLETTAFNVVGDIMNHTPRGTSPRLIPFSRVQDWERHLQSRYEMTPFRFYASTGLFTLRVEGSGSADCVQVPNHVVPTSSVHFDPVVIDSSCSAAWPLLKIELQRSAP